jgi:hypothetical protein
MDKVYIRLWCYCLIVLSSALMCLSRANAEVLVIAPDDLGPSHWGTCWSCEVNRALSRYDATYVVNTETGEVHLVQPKGSPDENGQPRSEPELIEIPIFDDWGDVFDTREQSFRSEESVDRSSSNTNYDASYSLGYN